MNSKYTGKLIEDLLDKISISGPGGSGGISVEEINKILDKCLRKDLSDRSPYSIASDEKIEVGEFRSGSSGAIIYIDKATGKTIAELDKLYIRMKAYFELLEIIKSNIVGGKLIISPAGGIKCSKVETYPSWGYYRCFFLAAQEGELIDNLFTIGDLAYSKTFNAKEGVYNLISNKYYWRLVVGVGEDYIDLSKSDCDADSDEPSVGDIICHRGNRNDIDRLNFIEFSSVDSFSPSITLYLLVNNYSLVDKAVIQFGVEKSTGKAFMNVYGDYYIGNRDKSSYISYTPETGVKIKGSLDVGTKLGDKTLLESIELASNSYKEPLDTLKQSINEELKNVLKLIDGVIETWFYEPIPTLTNLPASLWTTNNEKEVHLGDLYYSGSGRAYRFLYDSDTSNYYWNEIVDTDILLALENAKKALDTADSKRKTFVRKPENIDSYDIGDIWVNATYSDNTVTYDLDLLRAIEFKAVGEEFKIEHWTLASKYTDDTVANDALEKATNALLTINTLQGDVTDFKNYVDGAFLDGIISTSESQAIEKYINLLVTIKALVDNSYEEIIKNSVLTSTTYLTNLNNSYTAFSSSYNELINTITEAIEDNIVTDLEKSAVDSKYNTFNNKYKDYVSYLNLAINYIEETINNKADKALLDIGGYNYLKKALLENTSITGGLILSSMLSLGYTNSNGEFLVMAGTNGLVVDRGNKTIASWFGGGMVDMFDYYNSATKTFDIPDNIRVAKGVDRMDGTGYRANGKFWWDESGKLYADPLSFFVGDTSVGGLLAAFQIVMKSDGIHPLYLIPQVPFQSLEIADYIRIGDALLKYDSTNKAIYVTSVDGNSTIGFYSEGWVSAKGANPSSGGGSGASALYQLLDVLPNAGNDGVFNAVKGSVLTYNGTKWQAGTIHVPTNLSEFTNDSGFITSAAIPTELSAFTNDSGFITSAAIPTSLKNPYALKFGSQSYDGSSAKTITASDLGALTAHQSIYALTIKAGDATVLTFTPNSAAGSIAFVAGSNISLSADATNKKITIANTYSYTHPSGGANVTIASESGKVLGAITVNSLGHVTSVSAKTLVAADVTDLTDVLEYYATITYVNDELAGTNETVSALVEKVNNFLEGTDTDGIINKWKELEAFLAGQTQTSTLADLLNVKAFASTKIIAGTGLTGGGDLTADRTLSLAASGVTAGTYPKVTVDQYGRVTAGSSLLVDDIPNLPWSKITSGKPTTLTGYGITDGVNEVKIIGSGNAVTAASVSGHVLTLTKGVTFLPQSSFDDLFEKVLLSDGKTYAIRAKYGFYSDSFVSAKGLNPSSSGGGSGASALYQLLDVVPNSTGTGVLNAVSGAVLMYNGSKWQAGIISVPNALSQLTNDAGFITSAALPTKVSQLNNDAGYITGINSSMVVGALGYTPYNSSNPNGYITGISKSMVEGVLTGNITSHTHNNYVTLTGEGASGTWGINISGNATTATKLGTSTVGSQNMPIYLKSGTPTEITSFPEAYLSWGGKNFSGEFGPIDAIMIPELGACRSMFAKAAGIEVQYSRDGGATWVDYSLTDDSKTAIFSTNYNVYIGGTSEKGIDKSNYKLRVIVTTNLAKIFTKLNKIAIYLATNGSEGCYVTIDARTKENVDAGNDTWTTLANKALLWGFPGWNIINIPETTTYGNRKSHYQQIRFSFGATSHTSPENWAGLFVSRIMMFGGFGWDVPSTMARNGHLYDYDRYQNAVFPANVKATGGFIKGNSNNSYVLLGGGGHKLESSLSVSYAKSAGNASTATKLQTARTIWGQSFDGTGNVSGAMTGVTSITIGDCVITYDSTNKGLKFSTGIYSEQYVSAKGANASSGGGGGASALYQLLDVVPNSAGDGVLGAVNGSVLQYNGTKWKAGTISVPTLISQLTNDAGFITSASIPTAVSAFTNDAGYITKASIPTKLSAFTNDSGYITGITKAMVETVLTGNITTHTHSQYLTEHQNIYSLTLNAGTFIHDIYTPNSEAKTINIPTTTSHIREGNNLYFTNQRAINALSATLLGYQPLISDLEIIRNSASEGHTAYGWGNHANAGYLTTIDSTMVVSALGYTPYNSSNPNGYISGITKSMVENVLTGNITSHSHTFASITSKPTTIEGYGITDAITTGNIGSQSVSYATSAGNADTLDGYHADRFAFYSRGISTLGGNPFLGYAYTDDNNWATNGPAMTFGYGQYYLQFQYMYNAATEPYIRTHCPENGYSSWQQLAYLTSNVASATKLQTARTIWGQSFDGTGDIATSEAAKMPYVLFKNFNDDNAAGYCGRGSSNKNTIYLTAYSGNAVGIGANNADNILYISTSLNVGIGTTSPEYKLDVNGNIRSNQVIFGYKYSNNENAAAFVWDKPGKDYTGVGSDGTTDTIRFSACNLDGTWVDYTQNWKFYGNIAATGAITAKASSSDIRLKKDISSYSAIDIIRGHRSVKYHWNGVAKANSDVFKDDHWHFGLIAQELQQELPQMVSDVFKDYLVINYERLIPICWKGLQEVDDEVSRLKKKVRKLEMEIRELKQGA